MNFANFYKKFIRNFSSIVILFTLILQSTIKLLEVSFFSIIGTNKKQNYKVKDSINDIGKKKIKNLLITRKSKILVKCKKLAKSKKSDFAKINFFKSDFLISKVKKTFNYIRKALIKHQFFIILILNIIFEL